jgi:hypothetical protein
VWGEREKNPLLPDYARHGRELIGCKSLVSEPLYVKRTAITSERQLRSREAYVGRKPVARQ